MLKAKPGRRTEAGKSKPGRRVLLLDLSIQRHKQKRRAGLEKPKSRKTRTIGG